MIEFGYNRLSRVAAALQKRYDANPTPELKKLLDKATAMKNKKHATGAQKAMDNLGVNVSAKERFYKLEEPLVQLFEFAGVTRGSREEKKTSRAIRNAALATLLVSTGYGLGRRARPGMKMRALKHRTGPKPTTKKPLAPNEKLVREQGSKKVHVHTVDKHGRVSRKPNREWLEALHDKLIEFEHDLPRNT